MEPPKTSFGPPNSIFTYRIGRRVGKFRLGADGRPVPGYMIGKPIGIIGFRDPDRAELYKFHDPESERHDAKRIAKLFGVSLRDMSAWTGIGFYVLQAETDAMGIQERLMPLAASWDRLERVLPDRKTIRRWMRHPIHGVRPISLPTYPDGIPAFEAFVEQFVRGIGRALVH